MQGATWPGDLTPGSSVKVPVVSEKQRYRMRTPSTGREVIIEAEPDVVYRDRDTGEELQVLGKVLPLAPSKSKLPWTVENLRISPYTGQMIPKDLNDDPITGRRLPPLPSQD